MMRNEFRVNGNCGRNSVFVGGGYSVPIYRVGFVSTKTGKHNSRNVKAFDEADACETCKGEAVDGSVVSQLLPPKPATEAQIAYLKGLGVDVPRGLSRDEAIDLTDATLSKQPAINKTDLNVAALFRVEVTRYASKPMVYQRIFNHLLHREAWMDMTIWFVWRVSRHMLYHGVPGDGFAPDDPKLKSVAQDLMADPEWLPVLRRVCQNSVCGFRWFGVYKGHQGESMRTRAFQKARDALSVIGHAPVRPEPVSAEIELSVQRHVAEVLQSQARLSNQAAQSSQNKGINSHPPAKSLPVWWFLAIGSGILILLKVISTSPH
ncbi:hypothetical protein GOZ94_00625 [Agrobacterium vitis]|uniref:hypothetical protein n=1 Tax=Agrobacterium vitis TaxID=373 RepID=UPI0012E70AD4|nr:hypothetical protein [Agrobacterium vitis]MVA17449.1 hypothetical protein [Agrobacterium vitis]